VTEARIEKPRESAIFDAPPQRVLSDDHCGRLSRMYPIGYTADASTDDRGQAESDLIVLLVGGDKSSQWTDIEKAKALADNL
jgi:hypothetical protein